MKALILKLSKLFPQSLVAEIYSIFGMELTEKMLTIFAGTTLHIPSTKDLEEAERNLAIFNTLARSQSIQESRRLGVILCKQYGLKRREMRVIYKAIRRKLREAKRIDESDARASKHLPKKVKVKRKTKRRL